MFRDLTEQEQKEFRLWAISNYAPGDPIDEVWHPVVKEECARINADDAKRLCVICGCDRGEFGHSAQPLAAGRCCDSCNDCVIVCRAWLKRTSGERESMFPVDGKE